MRRLPRITLTVGIAVSAVVGALAIALWIRSYLPEIPDPTPPDATYVHRVPRYHLPGRDHGQFTFGGNTYHWGSNRGRLSLDNRLDHVIWVLKQLAPPSSGSALSTQPAPADPPPPAIVVELDYAAIVLGSLVLPALRVFVLQRKRAIPSGNFCPTCGYDLRATPNRCPECGTPAPTGPASTRTS